MTSSIIEAIAESKGVKPNDLEIVLNDYIDLDGVRQLAKHSSSIWTLEFKIPDHSVTVESNGDIFIDGQQERNWGFD